MKEKVVLKSIGYLFYFLFVSFASSFGVLLFKAFTDMDWLSQTYDALLNDDTAQYLKLILEMAPLSLLITDVLIVVPFIAMKLKKKEQIIRKPGVTNVVLMLFVGLFLNLAVTICCTYIPFPDSWQQDLSLVTSVAVSMPPVLSILCTGILAPVMEEIIFRYGIFNKLKQKNVTVALIVSSLLFGLMHGNVIQGGYAFLIGMVIAAIYNKTNNLLDAILIHVGVNLSSVLYTFTNLNEILYLLSLTVIFGGIVLILQKKAPFTLAPAQA